MTIEDLKAELGTLIMRRAELNKQIDIKYKELNKLQDPEGTKIREICNAEVCKAAWQEASARDAKFIVETAQRHTSAGLFKKKADLLRRLACDPGSTKEIEKQLQDIDRQIALAHQE